MRGVGVRTSRNCCSRFQFGCHEQFQQGGPERVRLLDESNLHLPDSGHCLLERLLERLVVRQEVENPPVAGLSPPTRGSLGTSGVRRLPQRSIPAHAGEPPSIPSLTGMCGVYPRPRGGAELTWALNADVQGLSPPTRGEPNSRATFDGSDEVYPRPRGGAGPITFPVPY